MPKLLFCVEVAAPCYVNLPVENVDWLRDAHSGIFQVECRLMA